MAIVKYLIPAAATWLMCVHLQDLNDTHPMVWSVLMVLVVNGAGIAEGRMGE